MTYSALFCSVVNVFISSSLQYEGNHSHMYCTVQYCTYVQYSTVQYSLRGRKTRLARIPSSQGSIRSDLLSTIVTLKSFWSIRILRCGQYVVVVYNMLLLLFTSGSDSDTQDLVRRFCFRSSRIPGCCRMGDEGCCLWKFSPASMDGLSHVLLARLHKHCLFVCCLLFFLVVAVILLFIPPPSLTPCVP